MKLFLFLFISVFSLSNCIAINNCDVQTAILFPTECSHLGDKVIIIYDFDIMRRQYDFRAVNLEKSSGDPLRDVVEVFLKENYYNANMSNVKLDNIARNGAAVVLNFKGRTRFKVNKEKEICLSALLRTIERFNKNLKVELNMK